MRRLKLDQQRAHTRAFFGALTLCVASSCLSQQAAGLANEAVYAAVDARDFSSDAASLKATGAKLGYEARALQGPLAGNIEAGYLTNSSGAYGILSLGAGIKISALRRSHLDIGGLGFLEYQHVRLDRFMNSNHLLAIGIGGYAEVWITSRISFTLTLSAHAFADATEPTTCRDGSTSDSTGSGTCSHHDGVAYYNDMIGNGRGLDALIGLSVWFSDDNGFGSQRVSSASPP